MVDRKKVTALDCCNANEERLLLHLLAGDEHIDLELDHPTAVKLAHIIADALLELQKPDTDPESGVALYEVTRSELTPETLQSRLDIPERFVLTARGQGSTKLTFRFDQAQVDALIGIAEHHSARKARSRRQ